MSRYLRLFVLAACAAGAVDAQTDGVWQGSNAQWSDTANWAGGAVPGGGGTALFKSGTGVATAFSNDVEGLTLGGLTFSNNVVWTLNPGLPVHFPADPASTSRLHVSESQFAVRSAFGTGAGTLRKTGGGYVNITNRVSALTGRWLIETGHVEIATGTSLLEEPAALRPDAIIMNGGGIKNNDSSPVFPPTMGITLQERGGFFTIGWNPAYTMTFASPITGPGPLLINRNNGRLLLQNPANDYAGGTVVGTNGPGSYTANYAYLQLDADGVLPYGSGKGGLRVEGAWRGLVDLAGRSNRVNQLTVTAGGTLTNRVPGAGALVADGLDLRGRLEAETRVVWGGGAFNARLSDGSGAGTIEIPAGATLALAEPQALGGAGLLVSGGGGISRATAPGTEAPVTTNSGAVWVGAGGATLAASGAEPYPALVLRGGLAEDAGNAAHDALACNTDLVIDGPAGAPAVFDAEVALPGGRQVTFRGSVWVARLPGAWAASAGSDVYLQGDAVAELAAFTNAGCRLRVVAANAAAFDPGFAVEAGGAVWYDTRSLAGGRVTDAAGNALGAAHAVALAGGTLGFDGLGSIAHSGAISGGGALVKLGAGTLTLTGESTFSGSVAVSNGVLAAGGPSALGAAGNAVVLAGGRLANLPDAALTLAQSVTLLSGGFTVNGGSLRLSGGLALGASGTLNKQGGGELILEGASLNAPNGLNLTGGAVVLEVAAGVTNKLVALKGSGDLIKRGPGVLIVRPDTTYTGQVILEGGTLYDEVAPAAGPALWLDASVQETLGFKSGTTDQVVRWNDVRDGASGTARPYAWLNEFSPNLGTTGYKTALPPTVLPNALAGKPVLDFGVYRSGQWLEFVAVSNARTFFWVIGSQNSGGLLIGSPDKAAARGGGQIDGTLLASHPIWGSDTWIAAEFRNSQTWTNGVSVNPNTVGLNGGYELVSTLTTAGVTVNGLAKEMRVPPTVAANWNYADGVKRSGGQRLAEVLIYDRALTDAERQATEAYLKRKWLGTGSGAQWGAALQVTGEGALVLPYADVSVGFGALSGAGTLTKSGAGTLLAESPESFTGTLALAEGAYTADGTLAALTAQAAPTNPVPGAAFWVDASAVGTFGSDGGGRVYWRDVRGSEGAGFLVATQRWAYAPTLLSNAVGALPVVDFGPTNTLTVEKGLQWSAMLSNNVRTVFWLIGSQQGGGIPLGGNDTTLSDFNRGVVSSAATPLYYAYTAANVRNGLTRLDGLAVNGAATGLSGGYQVLALRTSGPVSAGQFAHDRYLVERSGGQRLGEVIVYTNALSDADFAKVEAYLLNKWQRPATRGQAASLARLAAPVEGAPPAAGTLAVGVRELRVAALEGGGLLRKPGAATLTLGRCGSFTGALEAAGGRVALQGYSAAVRAPAFWVDASRTNTLELDAGTGEISKWHDCRFNGLFAAKAADASQTVGSTTYPNLGPTLAPGALNALPVVDFGAWMGNRFLTWSRPLTRIRTAFWVVGSQEGGGHLLTYDRDTATRHFFRGGSGPTFENWDVVTKDSPLWSGAVVNPHLPVINGLTRKNGVAVNGTQTGLGGGYDIVSLRTTGDASASAFCNDRARAFRNATGGQRLAEVLLYEEALTDDEIRQVESYLHLKWGVALDAGADVPSDDGVSPLSLTLSGGAVLELGGTRAHTLGALGGVGGVTAGALTVRGLNQVTSTNPADALALDAALSVAAGARWTLSAAAGGVAPVRSSAGLAFLGGGAFAVTGAAALADGSHLLAAAVDGAALTGFSASAWTVSADDDARQYSLYADGGAVYLRTSDKGVLMLLR